VRDISSCATHRRRRRISHRTVRTIIIYNVDVSRERNCCTRWTRDSYARDLRARTCGVRLRYDNTIICVRIRLPVRTKYFKTEWRFEPTEPGDYSTFQFTVAFLLYSGMTSTLSLREPLKSVYEPYYDTTSSFRIRL